MHLPRKIVNFVFAMSKQLNSEQRYEIYLGLKRKWTKKSIAAEIGVSASTVTREIQRNSNRYGQYVHTIAQQKCESRRHSTLGNHRKDAILWWRIEQMIMNDDWSPRQISGVLAKEGIHRCAQTIYNHVHADKTGKLAKHMPHESSKASTILMSASSKASTILTLMSSNESKIFTLPYRL